MAKNRGNKNRFPFSFKIDKDRVKLQVRKMIKKSNKRRVITFVILVVLLIGAGIAVYTTDYGSNSLNNSGVVIEPGETGKTNDRGNMNSSERSDSFLNKKIIENNLSLQYDKELNIKPEKDEKPDRGSQSDNEIKATEDTQVEEVMTRPVNPPLRAKDNRTFELLKPVSGEILRDPGWYFHPVFEDWRYQTGVIIDGKAGDIVMAAASGTVRSVREDEYYGIIVEVEHQGGWRTLYGNLQRSSVSPGEVISKGQEIGRIGNTGIMEEPSLYFELRNGEGPVNPLDYIK
ncbi:M23 family metallopeptidase [Halothermothrix orenii]|uniref:Peptidase M23B n=1 Tax=Halothermothrix orenii (strain H 168 / OCM 544 / DSM 9562) TaxID=373903 RepID=B8CZ05_HALOH|nr:M23 family metallopeptidase [Halothermothrix orenii]ACL70524.1 peptidase M23B [Halothermothrix orenii H 168]